ncbi:Transcriptional regulator [Bacillus sp. IT-79MI2]|uniref:hypothetical protein n=1 Tax=Bacillus sp. IT-79MI2 TaxID=3026438 RepID=UPI0039DF74C9
MYIFDVSYLIQGVSFAKSFLLAESKDGFELKNDIEYILQTEHQTPVQIVATDFEEL